MSVVDGLPFTDDKKRYIVETLDPVLEEMVSDVLTDIPAKPLDFMVAWLRKRTGLSAVSANVSIAERNKMLKQELRQIRSSMVEAGQCVEGAQDKEEEEEEEDDDCDEIPDFVKKLDGQMGRSRQSVSAEAYGAWHKRESFTPPVHPKQEDQKERLKQTLAKSFMFANLEAKDMDTIIMAMEEVVMDADQRVIQEGDDGDFLFVVETGSLDCVKTADGAEQVVKTCDPGDVFGELALLYNCPRAASVVARQRCVCWQLDRATFSHIVKDAAVRRRERYDGFLKSVALLSSLGSYERSQIADALVAETFRQGDVVVRQDEPGDKFYIVEEGALYATKGSERVLEYQPGEYFGELALLKNQPRAASVVVESSEAKVLSMTRLSFSKMLGPLQSLLARHASEYK